MTLTDNMYQEKEKEDLPALKTVLTHQYNDSKITEKVRRKTDYSHQKRYRQHENQQNENNQKKSK